MKTTYFILKSGVLHCTDKELPEEPKYNCRGYNGISTCCSIFCVCQGQWDQYQAALQLIKDNAVPFEDQVWAEKLLYGKTGLVDGLPMNYYQWRDEVKKDDGFCPLSVEVEIIEQYWTGNALSKNSRLPDWMDVPKDADGLAKRIYDSMEKRSVARIVEEPEEKNCKYCGQPKGNHYHDVVLDIYPCFPKLAATTFTPIELNSEPEEKKLEFDKVAVIHEAINSASKIMMMAYLTCDLKRGIETTVIEQELKKAFAFSFTEVDYAAESKKEPIEMKRFPKQKPG